MSNTNPTGNRRRVTDEQRIAEVQALIVQLSRAIETGDHKAAAGFAGQIQRRTRLLAGLGRGG